jgi:hypothetical protein
MSCYEKVLAGKVRAVQEAPSAILCVINEAALEPDKFWVPKALIDDCSHVQTRGDEGLILIRDDFRSALFLTKLVNHMDKRLCSRCGGGPETGEEEEVFLETGLCGWCYQVEEHSG